MASNTDRSSLTRFAWLSIAAAVLTIALKTGAYLLTGSVGLLSDALESSVNLNQELEAYRQTGVEYHELRTRQSGARRFVSLHVNPASWDDGNLDRSV